jgi:ribosomal protein L3 glutamine methyltransferase
MTRGAPGTVGEFFDTTVRRFQRARLHFGHGTHNARDEAAYLVLHALGLPLDSLTSHRRRPLAAAERSRLQALVERRVRARLPAAYLTSEAWLGDFSFYVDRRVIVPRSFIAELLREGLEPWLPKRVLRVLDLCTGSGCLAILAAHAYPLARIDASDVSAAALAVARRNVERYRLRRRIRLVRGNGFSALPNRRYDLILCNPPYVKDATLRALPREYRHEPRLALAGGRDGLDFVRRMLEGARARLEPHGVLVCEIGHNRRALERAYPSTAFTWLDTSSGPDHVFLLERGQLPLARRSASTCAARAKDAR